MGLQILLSVILVIPAYYFLFVAKKLQIYGSNSRLLEIARKFQTVNQVYYPTIFYCHGLLQSIFGLTKRMEKRIPYTREIFALKDGGEIGLDFLEPAQMAIKCKSRDTLVLILPGVTSSSQTSYIKTLALACVSKGATVAVMNNRGLGGVALKTPRLFSATNVDDLDEVIKYLKAKYPAHKKIAVGTSFGGILISQYMDRKTVEAKEVFQCAVLISPIWDPHPGSASIERPINKFFINNGIALGLRTLVHKHRQMLQTIVDVDELLKKITTLRNFDIHFTVPQCNYKNVKEYYDDTRITHRVKNFPIPVYALCAADDPMQPEDSLPFREAVEEGSNLLLIVSARGGHLGFLEGFLPVSKPVNFSERFVLDVLNEYQ